MHMMSKNRIKLRKDGHSEKVENPTVVLTAKWWGAHPRGGTSVRSRLKSHRNCAITRGNASSLIAGQALRRPRILLWVGKRSKATVDQRREEYYLQNGQFRTSCRSRIIHQFWKHFVFYIATIKLVEKRGGNSLWRHSAICFTFIFRSSIERSDEIGAIPQKP